MDKYITLTIAYILSYGIMAIIYKISKKSIDSIYMSFLIAVSMTVIFGLIWLFSKERPITPKVLELVIIIGVLAGISFLAYLLLVPISKISITTALRNGGFMFPAIVTVLLLVVVALLFFAEKITLIKALGIGFGLIAVILLTL